MAGRRSAHHPGLQGSAGGDPGRIGASEVTIDYTGACPERKRRNSLYRLTAADYDDGTFFHYSYDAVGNRLTQETLAGTNAYVYDIANRLTSVDGVSYTWDNNGNLLTDGTSTYTYNYANMLASVNQGGPNYTYAYSGLGDRLQQSIDGVTTNYTLDINAGLTQVLVDATHTYLYGQGRIAQDGVALDYFLGDALSSVRQLVDGAAEVTLTQSYEPFGSGLASEGTGESVFQFTGEARDGTNLTFLRARYYDSAYGRFTTKDIWNGDNLLPLTYNEWLYGYGNPVKYKDPTGYFSEAEIINFFGVDSWRDVLTYFGGGGRYEWKWGWLEFLRIAHNGTYFSWSPRKEFADFHWLWESQYETMENKDYYFHVNDDKVTIRHYEDGKIMEYSLFSIMDQANTIFYNQGRIVAYREPTYHTKVDFSKVDWWGATLDITGIGLDICTYGVGGRVVNAIENVDTVVTGLDLAWGYYDFVYDEGNNLIDFMGFSSDVAGVVWPIWPDLVGLGINFGSATYKTP